MPVQAQGGSGGIAPTHLQPWRSNRVMSAVRSGHFISGKDPVPIVYRNVGGPRGCCWAAQKKTFEHCYLSESTIMLITTRVRVLFCFYLVDHVQYGASLLPGYDAASLGNRVPTFRDSLCPQSDGSKCPPTWNLDISTLKNKDTTFFRNVGTRLRSNGVSAVPLRNAQNTQPTTCWK